MFRWVQSIYYFWEKAVRAFFGNKSINLMFLFRWYFCVLLAFKQTLVTVYAIYNASLPSSLQSLRLHGYECELAYMLCPTSFCGNKERVLSVSGDLGQGSYKFLPFQKHLCVFISQIPFHKTSKLICLTYRISTIEKDDK